MFTVFNKERVIRLRASKKAFLKLALVFASMFSVFLLTGIAYFRYDVVIKDGESERTVYTMNTDPQSILEENGISAGAYDRIEFTGFDDGSRTARLEVLRAFRVPVIVDGKEAGSAYNIDGTVSDLLGQVSVTLGKKDSVVPSPDTVVKDGGSIKVTRAFDVKITADGRTKTVSCNGDTVKELLDSAKITPDSDDIVSLPLDKKITAPCEIKVSRVEKKVSVSRKVEPHGTKTVADNLSEIGTSRVLKEGVDGVKEITVTETYIDGRKTDSSAESKVISKKADEVIAEGAAVAEPYCKIDDPAIVLKDGRPVNYEYIISGPATAYTAYDGAMTASGRPAEIGTAAVNPNVIPYGSLLYIVGQNNDVCYGYAIAADTGVGMMDGSIPVDVYMGDYDNYGDACAWGYQMVDIYVIEKGNG